MKWDVDKFPDDEIPGNAFLLKVIVVSVGDFVGHPVKIGHRCLRPNWIEDLKVEITGLSC